MKKIVIFVALVIVTMTSNTIINTKAEESSIAVISSFPKFEYKTVNYYDVPLSEEYQDWIREECLMAEIDMELVLAIMKVESDFNSSVISNTNDYGIMQINEINHEELTTELGIKDFLNPYDCARGGIYMLNHLNWCENETQMLMCYNMGVTGAKKAWEKGISETNYSKKVLKAKEEIGGKRYEIKILCN